jgi:hypothetical protein
MSVGTHNERTRHDWAAQTLKNVPAVSRLLDAGAGCYRSLCHHLEYVARDFSECAQYKPRTTEFIAIRYLVKLPDRCSAHDSGSDELLCSGYHVLAEKPRGTTG